MRKMQVDLSVGDVFESSKSPPLKVITDKFKRGWLAYVKDSEGDVWFLGLPLYKGQIEPNSKDPMSVRVLHHSEGVSKTMAFSLPKLRQLIRAINAQPQEWWDTGPDSIVVEGCEPPIKLLKPSVRIIQVHSELFNSSLTSITKDLGV